MHYLCIALFYFIGLQTKAQDINHLINSWVPTDIKDYTGESDSWRHSTMFSIITFQTNDTLELTYGGTNHKKKFFYRLQRDTLELKNSEEEHEYFKVLERTENRLKIFYDSFNIVTYQPFLESKNNISQAKLKEDLASNIWTFKQRKNTYKKEWSIDFRNGIQDSSLLIIEAIPYSNNAYFKETIRTNDHPHIWALSSFKNVPILRLEEVGFSSSSNLSGIFFIDSHRNNKLRIYTWLDGDKVYFTAKALEKVKKLNDDNLKNLFRTKWRFDNAKYQRTKRRDRLGLMDLGIEYDDFQILTNSDYFHDSTLLILSDDLALKQLILEFSENGEYGIYREKKIIDSGSWQGFFNHTLLKMESDTKYDSDGIVRGHIEIVHLSKNKLVLKREFQTRLNGNVTYESSLIETYRPVQKN